MLNLPRTILTVFAQIAVLVMLSVSNAAAASHNVNVGKALAGLFEDGKFDTGSAYVNAQEDRVRAFYAARNFKPVWSRDDGPKGKARALVGELAISAVHGLSPDFYNLKQINVLMGSADPKDLARLDLLLSGALVEFGGDLVNGRTGPETQGAMNAIKPVVLNADEYIREAQLSGNLREYMGKLLRSDDRYVRLITKLAEFLRLENSGQWPEISITGGEIPGGSSDPRFTSIRKLLVLTTGDLPIGEMNVGNTHDQNSIEAVKRYQLRHGLKQSGDIDSETLAAMAVPIVRRIQQIKTNLERRRWQVGSVANEHLYVNLADGAMRLVRDGKTVGRFSLLNNAVLGKIPAFLGSLNAISKNGESAPETGISVQSGYISKISKSGTSNTFVVEDIAGLAKALGELQTQPMQEISTGEWRLARPVPIYVTYVTAWATRDGRIHFRKDIFERDETLAALLAAP